MTFNHHPQYRVFWLLQTSTTCHGLKPESLRSYGMKIEKQKVQIIMHKRGNCKKTQHLQQIPKI